MDILFVDSDGQTSNQTVQGIKQWGRHAEKYANGKLAVARLTK